jgi:hypothetical protein
MLLNKTSMSYKQYRNAPPKTKREEPDTNEREGRDDSLLNSSPTDSRSDEKVVVNEQRANKIVNGPSQTAVNTSEASSYDEEIL